jgi:hypothetical protein
LPTAAARELSALDTRHHQLIEMMIAESNRRDHALGRTLINVYLERSRSSLLRSTERSESHFRVRALAAKG